VSKFELSETQFIGTVEQSGTKLPIKSTWSKKMIVLSTFLESTLNFLSDNLKKTTKLVRPGRKAVSKFELSETQFIRTVSNKIACKT